MIAQLTGRVDSLSDGTCVIDVAGVGYLVQASSRTLSALPQSPAQAKLLIETHVREDAILLYGFADAAERDWFRLLTTVQGVGGRGDRASLTRAAGVGPRLAIRLLTELRDKAGAMPAPAGVSYAPQIAPQSQAGDALSALVNLGYRRPEAQQTVARVAERLGENATLDTLIRDSLKELAQRAPG
jgi:Holliday junction DNA helicase RuvA